MLGKVNLCEARKLPVRQYETLLGNDKIFNCRKLTTWKADVLRSANISTDVTGVMFVKDGHFAAFNVQPVVRPNGYKYILDNLEKMWQAVSNSGNVVWGFLCGGLDTDSDRNLSPFSYELYNRIADYFDEKEFPFGMICGKKDVNTEDDIRIYKNKIYMCSENLSNCFSKKYSVKDMLDKIPSYYSDVIMPEDIDFIPLRESQPQVLTNTRQ